MAGYFLDFNSVLGIAALFHVSSNITKIARFRYGFDEKLIVYPGIPATLFVILGAYLSRFIDSIILALILIIAPGSVSLIKFAMV